MSALLPCPFCGGAAMHIQQNYVIGCQPCGVWMADSRKDEWNIRQAQPAPVVDDEAPKRVVDYITAFDKRLIGRGFDHAQRMEIVGLLVSKETQDAALAATAAPVLSDEQILANETLKYYFGLNGGKGPVSDKGHNIIQAVLTVATRGQP